MAGARDYSAAPMGSFCGTLDEAWRDGARLVVRDWKTGERARENTDPAEDNAQLAALALALLGTAYGDGAALVLLEIGFVGPGRDLEIDAYECTAFDLRARWEREIERAVDRVDADENLAPEPGAHCKWCPSRTTCPVAVRAMATVEHLSAMTEQEILTTAIASPAHAAALYVRAKLAQGFLDSVMGAVKSYVAANGPAPMGGGKVLKVQERSRRSVAVERVPVETMAKMRDLGIVSESVPIGKVPADIIEQIKDSAIDVAMFDQLAEVNEKPAKRAKKAAA